jgi:polyferredoxin
MASLRLLLVLLWIAVAAVTLWAVLALGLAAAPVTFVGDLAHPWRAQFYADLEVHLLLLAAWILFREERRAVGVLCGIATLLLGALFTLPYVLLASLRSRGDPKVLLLGEKGRR